ncbi:MAG: VOC family protein [Desertimonas sp.]
MIVASHALIYSDDAAATRAFFREVLGLPFVAETHDPDWLIFRSGPSEFGVHPTAGADGQRWTTGRPHQLAFIADDIAATKAELEGRGAVFASDIEDQGFGLVAMVQVPGADDVMIYEPRHELAYPLEP